MLAVWEAGTRLSPVILLFSSLRPFALVLPFPSTPLFIPFPPPLSYLLPPPPLPSDPWVMVKVPQGAEQVPASQPNAGSVGGRNQRHRMLQRQLFIKEQRQKVKEQKKAALKRREEEGHIKWMSVLSSTLPCPLSPMPSLSHPWLSTLLWQAGAVAESEGAEEGGFEAKR
ncbi:unnamed protein product [Closterium sp. Naga37s-1]|nr:unnamed protein product [Closterium sp. Naga37s-1]